MELMLIVYAVSIVLAVSTVIGVGLSVYLAALFISGLIYLIFEGDDGVKAFIKKYLTWPKTFFLGLFLAVVIPGESTIKYMAGAYLLQEVATSDTAKEIGSLSADAVKSQLKLWAKDNEQLSFLIDAANVPVEDK